MKKNIAIMFSVFLLSGALFCNDFVLGRKMQIKLKKLIIILIFLFSCFLVFFFQFIWSEKSKTRLSRGRKSFYKISKNIFRLR